MPTGIELSAGIVVGAAKPVDAKFGPYATTAAALADIPAALRYKGLTVGIETGGQVAEYWFRSGTADSDFVLKNSSLITGSGVASMQVVTALPATPSPTTFYIVIPSGATTASAVTLGSVSLLSDSGSGGGGGGDTLDGGGGGGGGGDTNFSPASLTSLALWLDATSGLYSATSGGSLVTANGAAIGRWEDRSSNARHFTQSTVNSRPVLATASLNGKNTISFDGTDDFLSGIYTRTYTAQTLFVLFKINAAKEYSGFFVEATSSQGSSAVYAASIQRASFVGSFANSSSVAALSSFAPSLGNFMIGSFTHSGSQILNYSNGVAASSVAHSLPSHQVERSRIGGSISSGTALPAGTALNGSIAEVIAYDRLLTTAERQQVESYLSTKWGIAL